MRRQQLLPERSRHARPDGGIPVSRDELMIAMMRSTTNALLRGGIGLVLVATFVSVLPARQAAVQAGSEAVPDLAMRQLSDFQIQMVNGRRMLRFTAMMVNVGDGHFEVRGSRSNTGQPMQVRQVIYETSSRTSPISRQIPTQAEGKWSGDGHNHWHVQEMMRYDMWGSSGNQRGSQGRLLLPGQRPLQPRPAGCRPVVVLPRLVVPDDAERAEQPDGDQHRLGRRVRVVPRLAVGRHHRRAGRDLHDPLQGRSVLASSSRRTRATTARGHG